MNKLLPKLTSIVLLFTIINISSAQTTDIIITKTVNDALVDEGQSILYTIKAKNDSPDGTDATGLIVTDLLPDGLTFDLGNSTIPSGTTYDPVTGEWNIGTLLDNVTKTITIAATVDLGTAASTITNTASVTSLDQPDPNLLNSTASVDIQVNTPDIIVTKTVDDDLVDEGQTIIYTVSAKNIGTQSAPATGLIITDLLPDGLTFDLGNSTIPSGTTYDPVTGEWNIGTLLDNVTKTITIAATVDLGTAASTITNTASVTSLDQPDPNLLNSTASVDIQVNTPDIIVTKTVDDDLVDEGQTIIYTVSAKNIGTQSAPATGLIITDLLPDGLTFDLGNSTIPSGTTYDPVTGEWNIGTLLDNVTKTITIAATVDLGTSAWTITNTASVTSIDQIDTNLSNDTASIDIIVNSPDIDITKEVSNGPYNELENVTYTITIDNVGTGPATSLTVQDILPAVMTYVSHTVGGVTNDPSYVPATGILDIGNLAIGTSVVLEIVAYPNIGTSGTNVTNTALVNTLDQTDSNSANDLSSVEIIISKIDLFLQKIGPANGNAENDVFEFQLKITNINEEVVEPISIGNATNINVEDILPAGYTFSAFTTIPNDSDGNATTATETSGVISWDIAKLNSNANITLKFNVSIDVGYAAQSITNTAEVTDFDQVDVNLANNTSSSTQIINGADLEVTKTVDNIAPNPLDTITYTVVITNNGPLKANNITVLDLLPMDVTFESSTISQGSNYNEIDGTWFANDINAGESATLEIKAIVNSGTVGISIENTASIQSVLEADSFTDNNSDSAVIAIGEADLGILKTVDQVIVDEGDTVNYSIIVENHGPHNAPLVIVKDLLPSEITYISHTGGTYNNVTGEWSVGTLNDGIKDTLSIKVLVNTGTAGRLIENSASVSSPMLEPSGAIYPNEDTASFSVHGADLSIEKTISNLLPIVEEDTITYVISLTNNGPDNATDISVTDYLPLNLDFISFSSSEGTYDNVTGIWDGITLNATDIATLTIVTKIVNGGGITNTATILSSSELDSYVDNNTSSVSISALKTFNEGACIINMSVSPQTIDNTLPVYGLIYELIHNNQIPVYWAIRPDKSYTDSLNKIDEIDFTVDGVDYSAGAFIIDELFIEEAQATIDEWTTNFPDIVINCDQPAFQAPIHDVLTSFSRSVLDEANGGIAESFFWDNIGLTNTIIGYYDEPINLDPIYSLYRPDGAPSNLNICDDFYTMPHADPHVWDANEIESFDTYIKQGGWLWAACHAVSSLEALVDIPSIPGGPPQMNYLSVDGLIEWGNHGDGTLPYFYSDQENIGQYSNRAASDPFMQFLGKLDGALQSGSEQVYIPLEAGWRPTTTVAVWDPDQPDAFNGGQYPSNAAALVAYGRAFGNPDYGMIVYETSHSVTGGTEQENVSAARVYGNTWLQAGVEFRPEITPTAIPENILAGQTDVFSVVYDPNLTYQWYSSCGGTFSHPDSSSTQYTPPSDVEVETRCVMRLIVQDPCGRTNFLAEPYFIYPYADIEILKTATPSVMPGDTITYNINVKNLGPSNGLDVKVKDILPTGTIFISSSLSKGSYVNPDWIVGDMDSGSVESITLKVLTDSNLPPQILLNTATVSTLSTDTNPLNDSSSAPTIIEGQPPVAVDDVDMTPNNPNTLGNVSVIANDSDPDADLNVASVNFDPTSVSGVGFDTDNDGDIDSVFVAGQGSWVVDNFGDVIFTPVPGFTYDPDPIDYNVSDNTLLFSNTANITIDYVPIANNDLSAGNTTNTNVIVDILANDTDGDLVDATTVSLGLTGLPVGATCTATDAGGDCIEVTVPGQGVYSVNETTGAITFDPEAGFTANPDPITYTVEDEEGNPDSALLTIEFTPQAPTATNNESLANVAGDVTQQVVTEDDGDGIDADPDGSLSLASVDLDPATAGVQSSLIVAGEGTWSVDAAGNVTFAPEAGFTNDPTPIDYTINDNDGNTSNIAVIVVDYVPVATDDLSAGNTTNTNVIVDILANDTDGDLVDATTVSLGLTGLPVGATCTATDVAGDCIEVTIPGQGVYSVNETTGAITFDPEVGFTANPDPITYTVKDDEGNPDSGVLSIEFTPQAPTATNNESLANVAGDVTQQVVTEDDGDGIDADPDGSLSLASVDLDPATAGVQSSLIVAGEGTWSVDAAGNVTFAPEAGFTNDPTPIDYTINDNDGNTSNIAVIVVDYVPVATDDLSAGNTTNTNVIVDILANDTDGDFVDATTVTLELTGLPAGATCTATDVAGDCIEVTIPGQGVYSVNETTGAITFDPEVGFTANPDPITYTVEDEEGNPDSALLTIEFTPQAPTATNNESLANVAGDVTQQVVTEDDGDGIDADPDGSLSLASVDLDPATAGVQSSLIVAGEGTWSVDGAGNVTFAPEAGFTNDPTPIDYTINDNDGNTSNIAVIVVDYVPVATDDLSAGNTTNTNVIVDILANDTDGDFVDATTVTLELTGLPVDATCTATDAGGDCIEVTIPGQGVYSVNETTGAITFDPEVGFTANPDPITYTVKDDEGNPDSGVLSIEFTPQAPTATNNESLANVAGDVTQQVVTEDDGDGIDADPDGSLSLASVDLDPATAGVQSSLIVAGEGTWSVDGAGNVTFAPIAGFTNDPTPIDYTINDNDGNTSNIAVIVVDYVPVATDDLSAGNTTNTNVIVDILANDTDGDLVDATTVTLELTGLPVDATCTATDAGGDCIEVTVPGQGVYSVNETTGAITFDPEAGFTANPDPITYTVEDDEGNPDSALLTIEFTPQAPTATNNESLANVAGDVTQQVVTEDDGDGIDADPDGSLSLASVDLDPATAGVQSSLIVAGEGTWSVDAAGNVTFAPEAGFTNDPTPIDYTINDNDGNTSNIAVIVVDYVPVATDDLSAGNTTNTNVIVDILANDTDGDFVDATTVTLELTGLPAGATCTATDAGGDCIEVTVPGQGVYSVNETTGAITFDPEVGFTANPDPITYTVKDDEGNPDSALLTIEFTPQAPTATNNESLANVAGDVTQQVVTEDDGDGIDADPDGSLSLASVDLDPATAGVQSSLIVAGEGTWSVDGAGNVTFAPEAGFTNDPTPIDYTINDNDGNTSNIAVIVVDYVPVATDDLSAGNTTNTNVIVDILANDTDGDLVDATTVTLELTGLPAGATCTATDVAGDCIEVTVPGQGVYSVNETTGAITFDPEVGFTANPDPITYTVKDDEGNPDSGVLSIEFTPQAPTATNNESLANVAGDVTQQVVTEDDGDGIDADPDGSLSLASVDLDPATAGVQSSLIVAGEGTWSVDGAGNVTFAPIAGFTNDPTPIDYTINDNDGNTSNIAVIVVDYVPVATDDLSAGNTTNTNVIVDILANDTDGDLVDATTVTLELTGLPVDATCTATDAGGDCIEVTIPGQGVYSVNETTGAITFDPEVGFTANPDPITYTVKDDEGNPDSGVLSIEFTPQAPTATNNESLANVAGDVTQQVVTEDDGDGIDADPDGSLSLASVDLDPATTGVQSSLIVAGEGTWSVDGAGNVTFAPEAGFTNDPTPIDYTINDNDGNTSNIAVIVVDYVPVATDDLSAGNTTNTNVIVDILANDTDGDFVDATTVTLELTGLPAGATCTATDAGGDCIEVTIPGQGVYSVNETTGAITFDPEVGFTANPDPITYTVKDDEGNPDSGVLSIEFTPQAPTATNNESLANVAGDVTQQVVTEDDGDGIDADPDGSLSLASVDLDPATAGVQSSLIVAGEGTWSVDGAGNVTFAPIAGFTNDPTPIDYTINDNDGNTSNIAVIVVDYVPVATDDLSAGNTTNTNVIVDILANDTDGDLVDATTVSLGLTGLPVGATCTATDAGGDCIEVTVPGQGVYSVNETTGAITFDPEAGFTANPDPITYTVEDEEGNPDSALLTIEFTPQAPTATNNESLANVAGDVTQQVVTEDDGDGIDADPDGSLSLASVDLDPATAGVQSSLIVAGEGTWSVDAAGNVTFAPEAGFTNDPTPIDYTINDNDGNTSNIAVIVVDYVPVATDDLSAGNTTNTNVIVDILANDTDGDFVDATTVTLELTGLPAGATCTATDAGGDCIEVTVPGQGVYSVNETTGAITFDPEAGFTANPDPITYTVEDDEGNPDSAVLTIGYEGCLKLNLRVYLEGSLVNNGGSTGPKGPLMRDDLRSSPYPGVIGTNYLPAEEPYSSLPSFTHVGDGGGEIATSTAFDDNGENSVVDWVFVELRDKLDSTSVILTRSALLQKDGDVVDIDGVSPLQWCGLPDDTYYIVIRHRNHLGAMTSQPEVLTVEGTIVDFTNGNFNLSGEYNFGTNHPEGGASGYDYEGLSQKNYLGVRALWLGNAAHNDKVKYESPGDDKSQILFDVLLYPTNTSFQGAYDFGFGYHSGDLNMDSKVKYEAPGDDQSLLLFQILLYPLNASFQSAFDFMYEQIPNN